MKQHVKVVGVLHIGMGALVMLIACLTFVILIGVARVADEPDASDILRFIAVVVGFFLTAISLPGIVGGIGLLLEQEWGRILVLISSAIHLFNIPIGTALGVYSIWILVHPETAELFGKKA